MSDVTTTTVPTGTPASAPPVLRVRDLTLDLIGDPGQERLVDQVSFDVASGECLALIGESGCGKTLTAMSVLGLLPDAVRIRSGEVELDGTPLTALDRVGYSRLRGREIGAIFQDPMSSLDPTMRVGDQIAESRRLHLGESAKVAMGHAVELLDRVGIPDPKKRLRSFPFELSGGMQQRVMIAAAIACNPRLLVADEPTTALDVTIQDEILNLLRSLRDDLGLAVLLVTHDLGVVADFADQVAVMYAGQVVETATALELFDHPRQPYTRALIASVPQRGNARTHLQAIGGRVPAAGHMPSGCRFRARCGYAIESRCSEPQDMLVVGDAHECRCCRVFDAVLREGSPA